MFSNRIQKANNMYRSAKLYVYQVTWTNTITGNKMLKNFASYDAQTAEMSAQNLKDEVNSRQNHYPAKASWTNIGIRGLHDLPNSTEIVRPSFDCYY